jgi:hypothetical protein
MGPRVGVAVSVGGGGPVVAAGMGVLVGVAGTEPTLNPPPLVIPGMKIVDGVPLVAGPASGVGVGAGLSLTATVVGV